MKERLSVTVDAYLLAEGRAAVEAGLHHNLSAWVSAALRAQSEHDQRMRAADEFFAWYETEYGEITEEEMENAHREHTARAASVNIPDGEECGDPTDARRTA
ncbi:hypothetical protein [Pseudonocardia sp.]|uniref:hypothetical protein n=1 Tax=Pseudonocardia sp. TaxID=60912 RepID=UPI00262A4D04|nr:hypothetical protein [Pseudonocardia sp.]